MLQTTTGETPFNLTYGTDAMIPVEVNEPTLQRQIKDWDINKECLRTNLDFIEKLWEKAKNKRRTSKEKSMQKV